MSVLNLLPTLSRLSVCTLSGVRNISAFTNPLYFKVSNVLLREPLKKKRRLDPAVVKAREDRKKRKIEKQIRRLEKVAKQLKPIKEIDVPYHLETEKKQRLRDVPPLSEQEIESRMLLQKEWNRHKSQQHFINIQKIDSMLYSQQKALDELRAESEELYQEAIQIDLTLLPYAAKGPLKTPPIDQYDSPDGEYINMTRKFEGEE